MSIITLSREFGSGGDEVARRLCEELGYQSFGKEQIIQAARETTLGKYNAIDYSEDNHEGLPFLDQLFRRSASTVQKIAWTENPSIAKRPEHVDAHEAAVLSLTKRAIQASVKAGNFVIVGRGGQVLLQGIPGILHVRIEAPVEIRIERVKQQMKSKADVSQSEEKVLQTASQIITDRDKASADYIKRYFNVDWHDPQLYHMVLNLGKLNVDESVEIIVVAAQSLGMRTFVAL